MAGIIFPDHPIRRRTTASLDRRRLLMGSLAAAIAGGSLVGHRAGISAQTPDASPAATPAATPIATTSSSAIADLLRVIPLDAAQQAAESGILFYYADVAQQLDAFGIDRAAPRDADNLVDATIALAVASQAFQYALADGFEETFGFQPLSVGQTVYFGTPPHDASVFRGGIDIATVTAALEASGYEHKTFRNGGEYWTLSEDGEVDLTSPVMRFGVGALNNAGFLDDDTVVFSRFASTVEGLVEHAQDGGKSLIDIAAIAASIDTFPADIVSVIGVAEQYLAAANVLPAGLTPEQLETFTKDLQTSNETIGALPRITFGAFGVHAGATVEFSAAEAAPADATPEDDLTVISEARFTTSSPEDAEQAAKVIAWRWEEVPSAMTAAPYSEIMTLVEAAPSPENPSVVALGFGGDSASTAWIQMVTTRDLLPFVQIGDTENAEG